MGDLVAVFEATRLEPARFYQAFDAVVGFAKAEAHFRGRLALAQVGLVLDEREQFMCDFFVHYSGTLPPIHVDFCTGLWVNLVSFLPA